MNPNPDPDQAPAPTPQQPPPRPPTRRFWRSGRIVVYAVLIIVAFFAYRYRSVVRYMVMNQTLSFPRTTAKVLEEFGPAVRAEFEPICTAVGIDWPPARIQMLAFKQERSLELWGGNLDGPLHFLAEFPVVGMSGQLGPKRKSGDRQVPEGFYRLNHLNPQSAFHLSIRVDYPNQEDIENRQVDLDEMGGDIYIHGREASIGCLAMGDPAIEKIFCLTAWALPDHRNVIISPVDFRTGGEPPSTANSWLQDLYVRQQAALEDFQRETPQQSDGEV